MTEPVVKNIIRPVVQSIAPAGFGLPVDAILTEGDVGEFPIYTEGDAGEFILIKEGT